MPNKRRRLTGQVVSNKMDKTVVVEVKRTMRHPLYEKVLRETKRYKAHNESNELEIGDVVVIVESRPISKTKRWAVQEVIREDLSARATELEELVEVIDELIEEEEPEEADETGEEEVEEAEADETE
jgi:small subunit ribosomal protein S17